MHLSDILTHSLPDNNKVKNSQEGVIRETHHFLLRIDRCCKSNAAATTTKR